MHTDVVGDASKLAEDWGRDRSDVVALATVGIRWHAGHLEQHVTKVIAHGIRDGLRLHSRHDGNRRRHLGAQPFNTKSLAEDGIQLGDELRLEGPAGDTAALNPGATLG